MTNEKSQEEKMAAENKAIGFDYQYYFFLWQLLAMKKGDAVGLEVRDDVHISFRNGEQALFQLKHTVQKKSDGTPKNLTTFDDDLWKTLSSWAKLISDKVSNRGNASDQLKFVKSTKFVLASNKSLPDENIAINSIADFQLSVIDFNSVIVIFNDMLNTSRSTIVKEYITSVLALDENVLESFLGRINFSLNENDLIQRCKEEIIGDKIQANRVDDVFTKIDSNIRQKNYATVRQGDKIEITFEQFYRQCGKYYELARSNVLQIKDYSGVLPANLEDQIFIKQLIEIGDISEDEIAEISNQTRMRLKLLTNISELLQSGELVPEEQAKLVSEAQLYWRTEFRKTYRGLPPESEHNPKALALLDAIRGKSLLIAGQLLDIEMSNGTFYELSNSPTKIGWRSDWMKYQK